MVRETRGLELARGLVELSFKDVSARTVQIRGKTPGAAARKTLRILETGEVTTNFQGRYAFPEVPANLLDEPTLVWLLRSDRSQQDVEVTYVTLLEKYVGKKREHRHVHVRRQSPRSRQGEVSYKLRLKYC